VAVEVGLAVGRVDGPVQPLAVAAVGHRRAHDDDVVCDQVGQLDPPFDQAGRVERPVVEPHLVQCHRCDVEPRGRAGVAAPEPDGTGALEGHRPGVEVQVDVVRLHLDEDSTGLGLVAGEARHGTKTDTPEAGESASLPTPRPRGGAGY
jgi:hypothetical protein